MTRIHRVAGLKISRVLAEDFDPVFQSRPSSRDALPDLEPAEDRLRRLKNHIFAADSIALTHASAVEDVFTPAARPEHGNLTARATVYAMNLTVMVLSLPIGLALLFFNILGGENLRTTAHVMGLTGMAVAIAGSWGETALLGML